MASAKNGEKDAFAVSGVECSPFLLFFASHGYFLFHFHGRNIGAFLPASISNRGFGLYNTFCQAPQNQLYNVLACPAGVWRWLARRALVDAACILYGGGRHSAGVFLGAWLRLAGFADLRRFMLFCGHRSGLYWHQAVFQQGKERQSRQWQLPDAHFFLESFCFFLGRNEYKVKFASILPLSLAVASLVGGIYGVGGGAIMSPFLISFSICRSM